MVTESPEGTVQRGRTRAWMPVLMRCGTSWTSAFNDGLRYGRQLSPRVWSLLRKIDSCGSHPIRRGSRPTAKPKSL